MSRRARALAAAAAALATATASACGVCVEDKVAATYDHAVVMRAPVEGRVVVFAEPRAAADPAGAVKRCAVAAARTRGVDPGTVRSSSSPAAMSFALDPRQASPEQALAAIARSAKVPGLALAVLKVVR